jgi:hypothetical protein
VPASRSFAEIMPTLQALKAGELCAKIGLLRPRGFESGYYRLFISFNGYGVKGIFYYRV